MEETAVVPVDPQRLFHWLGGQAKKLEVKILKGVKEELMAMWMEGEHQKKEA